MYRLAAVAPALSDVRMSLTSLLRGRASALPLAEVRVDRVFIGLVRHVRARAARRRQAELGEDPAELLHRAVDDRDVGADHRVALLGEHHHPLLAELVLGLD